MYIVHDLRSHRFLIVTNEESPPLSVSNDPMFRVYPATDIEEIELLHAPNISPWLGKVSDTVFRVFPSIDACRESSCELMDDQLLGPFENWADFVSKKAKHSWPT